ncbi:predicted protein [Postia placenta Mad-698-R]|uniref:Uncharacterized protein n=1 Tax=Postia placenta MAD-698-R-SB12 TaxID=670580 RepID=A0A1X6MXW8_9APHY|nr:hypothetical protein POSPLADRAFT_1146846 [Postia placenta MAD-698-R-SB12]EED80750.1 predicted protein [Postia placenta Mad-698-R]OSX61224.1 hypothetical protein POSPLADRAFT_1146846 [Postia placenta MAD-698-R-SB12]
MTNDERTNNDLGTNKVNELRWREARSDDSDERKANVDEQRFDNRITAKLTTYLASEVYIHTKEPRQDDVTTMLEGRTMTYKSIRTSKPVWLIETPKSGKPLSKSGWKLGPGHKQASPGSPD